MSTGEYATLCTNTFCLYYGGCRVRAHNPEVLCPIAVGIDPCFCLTLDEVLIICAYLHSTNLNAPVELVENDWAIPSVEQKCVKRYISDFQECVKSTRAREGAVYPPIVHAITSGKSLPYWQDVLLTIYVIDSTIDSQHFVCREDFTDDAKRSSLLRLIAGFLYFDNAYATRYFAAIGKVILAEVHNMQFDTLRVVKKIISYVEGWKDSRLDSIHNWSSDFVSPIETETETKNQLIYSMIKTCSIRKLKLDTSERKPSQWAVSFIRVINSIDLSSMLSKAYCEERIKAVMSDIPMPS